MKIDGLAASAYGIENAGHMAEAKVKPSEVKSVVSFGSSFDEILLLDREKKSILGDGSLESIKDQATMLKNSLSAIFTKMDTGSVVKIDGDGVDINNTETDKIVTVVEQIQMKLAMYCDDFEATVDIDMDDVISTMGSGAAAYKIAEKFNSMGITATKKNVSETMEALSKAAETRNIDDNMRAYLIQNRMQPTISNVYIAAHAGYTGPRNELSVMEWKDLKPQVENILSNLGIDVTEDTVNTGKWMIENNIEITEDNFIAYEELDEVRIFTEEGNLFERITANIIEGNSPKDTLRTGKSLPYEEAMMAMETIENVTDNQIKYVIEHNRPFTVQELAYSGDVSDSEQDEAIEKISVEDVRFITASRKLQEARLIMTFDALRNMERSGISINTMDIANLVDRLKEAEIRAFDEAVDAETVDKVNDTLIAIDNLKYVHCRVVGEVISAEEAVTVSSLSECERKAVYAYEALATEVRRDLGDSKIKAIEAGSEEILRNLGYEADEDNKRAVRILVYNDMEVTEKLIDKVKQADFAINQMFRSITPQKVLRMIRDGINPIDTPVDTLNDYLFNLEAEETRVEKYSEFLYRLDKKGEITAAEREKYIGIYSLVRCFSEGGQTAVGQLVNQGLELNMGNLLSAYMSQKDRNMNMTVDDDTNIVEIADKISYFKGLFREITGKITPDKLKKADAGFEGMSVKEFVQEIVTEEIPVTDPVYTKYVENAENATRIPEYILKELVDYQIPATYNNIFAAQAVANHGEEIFREIKKRTGEKDAEKKLFEALTDRETAKEEYENVFSAVREVVNNSVLQENKYVDMEAMRQLSNNMRYINSLAKKNNFILPYEENDRKGIINLKIIENSENSGALNIEIRDSIYGRITVDGKYNGERLNAMILCENREFVVIAEEKKAGLVKSFTAIGIEQIGLSINYAETHPKVNSKSGEANTEKIFSIAKLFIGELTK